MSDIEQKDLFGNVTNKKVEEKVIVSFEKGLFNYEFIDFNTIEEVIINTKKIIKGSLEELKKEKKISKMLDNGLKVKIKKGSFVIEILAVYYSYQIGKEIGLFDWISLFLNNLKKDPKEFNKEENKNSINNKGLNIGTKNTVNNYYNNCNFYNKDKTKKASIDNESEKNNALKNLEIVEKEEFKEEKLLGTIIQENINSNSKDYFQPKHSSKEIKIEFPSHIQKENFFGKEIFILGKTHYKENKILKIEVIEIIKEDNLFN